MRRHRIFVDQALSEARELELQHDTARYIQQVLRLKAGQPVVVFDGNGGEYEAELVHVRKQSVRVRTHAHLLPRVESPLDVHVGQGLARGDRMDYAIQKAVELGARTVTPLSSERSVVKLTGERTARRLEHWRSVAVHAAEQCGRTRLAAVGEAATVTSWLEQIDADLKICLHPRAGQTIQTLTLKGHRVALLVGPEGGLTDAELERAVGAGFIPTRLGPRVLRAETATVVGITAVQLRWGDLSGSAPTA